MSGNKKFCEKNNAEDLPDDLLSQPGEDDDDAPHILHLLSLVKNLYVNDGVELTAISGLFKQFLTFEKIVEWKNANNWDEEKKKLERIKTTLHGNARQLVKMTLAVARIDPTANNISAYKRAIESLIVLKRTMPVKNRNSKDETKITPEHIAEFAGAAGLDYVPEPAILPGTHLPESESNGTPEPPAAMPGIYDPPGSKKPGTLTSE
jgi:hypothetical protein